MSCAALMSSAEIDEYEVQTGVMRPGSRAAIERGKRLSLFLTLTEDKVWIEGQGLWTLVPKDWCKQSADPGRGTGWAIDKPKRALARRPRGRPRGRRFPDLQPSAE